MKTIIHTATFVGLSLFLALVLLPACQQRITYPSVPEATPEEMTSGAFVWRDLITRDPLAARQFYGEVFGWAFETLGSEAQRYILIRHDGKPIGGIFPMPVDAAPGSTAEWINLMAVSSVKGVTEAVKARGGKVIFPPADLKGRGMSALVADPQGAMLGLVESGVPTKEPSLNGWLWTELWSGTPTASADFYQSLLNYKVEKMEGNSPDYWIFEKDNVKCAGLIQNPMRDTRSQWLPYIRVADPAAITEKAKAAGATVLAAPSPKLRNGNVAVLMDPTGAPFVVQRWPME